MAPGYASPEANELDDSGATVTAFDDFVAARLQALVRFGLVLTGNSAAAEDLVQTALAKSYAKWDRIEATDPEGYVRRVMANTHASWWRTRKAWRERPYEQLPEPPPSGPGPYAGLELREAMWQALNTLSARQRCAVVLRFYEDCSMAEIGAALGCRTGTAKSLVSRGLTALQHTTGLQEATGLTDSPATGPSHDGSGGASERA